MLFLIGLISGIVSGMGIGGGTVLIPALIFFTGTSQHIAQSVNLFSFFPTALIAIFIHAKNNRIKFKTALYIFLCGVIGAVLGSQIAVSISARKLKTVFGIFLFLMGIYEFFRKGKQ